MRSIEYIPLKTPEGAVCGHARMRDGMIEVSMRRRLEGAGALVDGSGRLTPLCGRVRAEGASAILWHDNGMLRCFGFPRGSTLNTEKLRLLLSAASEKRPPDATPPQAPPPVTPPRTPDSAPEAPPVRGTLTERALGDASRGERRTASTRRKASVHACAADAPRAAAPARKPLATEPDDDGDEASFAALMARADAVFRTMDAPAPPMREEAFPPPMRAETRRYQRGNAPLVAAPPVAAPPVNAPLVAAPPVAAPPVNAPLVAAPPVNAPLVAAPLVAAPPVNAPCDHASLDFTSRETAPQDALPCDAAEPPAAQEEAPQKPLAVPPAPTETRRFERIHAPAAAPSIVPPPMENDAPPIREDAPLPRPGMFLRDAAETAETLRDEGAEWYRAVDALLSAPGAVRRAPVPVQNPFPHIFPDARFTMERGAEGELLSGQWRQGREELHVTAVRGEYSPQPPAHLPGFTRYIRTRQGGYWVRVEEPEEE